MYLWFGKILKQNDPHFYVAFLLGTALSVVVQVIFTWLFILFLCKGTPTLFNLPLGFYAGILFITILLYHYDYKENGKTIVLEKQLFFNNEYISIIVSIFMNLFILSYLYWGAIIEKSILDNCK